MIDNNFNVQEYKGNFGVETDVQGNLLTPTISIGGIEVSEDFLKDCLLMACSCAAENQGIENDNVRAFIADALTIYHILDGYDRENAETTATFTLLYMKEKYKKYYATARLNPNYTPKSDEFTPKYE